MVGTRAVLGSMSVGRVAPSDVEEEVEEVDLEVEVELDLRFFEVNRRPPGRTLGAVARQFLEDGGPPPVPVSDGAPQLL